MNLRKIVVSALLLNLLAACGGGRGGEETVTADDRKVPASALASASAYSQWAGSLATSDTAEAVSVDASMMAPKSESDDPIVVR